MTTENNLTPPDESTALSSDESPMISINDDETVSSAPPRLEIDTTNNVDMNAIDKSNPNQADLHVESPPLITPTFSNKKFVTFLSDVEGTPIAPSKSHPSATKKERQPSIDEGGEEDEKKEDPKDDDEAAPDIASTPVESVSVIAPSRPSSIHTSPSRISYVSPPGRRSITLRLLEEVDDDTSGNNSALSTPFKRLNLKRFRSLSLSTVMVPLDDKIDMTDRSNNKKESSIIDRGIISVSWYEGTTSNEMQEHVTNCVLRKLRSGRGTTSSGGKEKMVLEDVRLLDENDVPHEGQFVF
jgi:hypothetical protein